MHFDDPSALAQPFSVDVGLLQGQGRSTVTLRNQGDNQLDDFGVSSNSTGMVHSEQMFNLGGTLDWQSPEGEPPTLENNTRLKFSGVLLIRRRPPSSDARQPGAEIPSGDEKPANESAWIGELAAGGKAVVEFKSHDAVEAEIDAARERAPLTTSHRAEGALSLRRLTDIADDHQTLRPGDVRMIAWRHASDESGMPGLHVVPAASQARRATLVVANLAFGAEPARADQNLRAEVQPTTSD